MKLFNLTLALNGFPIDKAQKQLKDILAISEEDYPVFLENKKQEILTYHLNNNTFYKNLVGLKEIKNWNDLPVLNKKNLQKSLPERLSNGYSTKNTYTNKTSGSSGQPFVFAKDKYAHAMTWASNCYRFGWYGIDFNTSLQARFYGIPLGFFGNKKERFKDFLANRFRFSIFDLSESALDVFLVKFKEKKFDYINGYTSSIVQFAKFLKTKNLILKDICPSLKVCIVTSEMLFENDKILLAKQFGIPIVNEYGASELDLIAFENPDGEWQLNSETLFIEILDANNKAVPNGKEGRIIITSLFNKAHPFIRYDIGDIGILEEQTSTKKPILKKLIGRTNDIAILPSGKKSPGLTFYYITKSIIEDDGNVKEFRIKQTKIDTFEIEYVSDAKLNLEQQKKIEQAITLYLEDGLNLIFIKKEMLQRSKSGKLKQFTSLL